VSHLLQCVLNDLIPVDTFQCHWKWCLTKPSLDIFDVPHEIQGQKAEVVLNFFLGIEDIEIDNQLALVNAYFPVGYQRLASLRATQALQLPQPNNGAHLRTAAEVQRLLTEKDHNYQPLFRDFEDFRTMKTLYAQLNDKKSKNGTDVQDSSFICDNWAASEVEVGRIFGALVDMTDIRDKGKTKLDPASGLEVEVKEEATAVRRMINSSNLELQLLAWDILVSERCSHLSLAITTLTRLSLLRFHRRMPRTGGLGFRLGWRGGRSRSSTVLIFAWPRSSKGSR
jgi:hypothetical protein